MLSANRAKKEEPEATACPLVLPRLLLAVLSFLHRLSLAAVPGNKQI